MLILLLILVAVPIVEIYLFIEIGGAIGVGRTIGIVIITAVIGGYMLRREGRAVLKELAEKADEGDNISETLVQGVLVLLAGALLLTPGFLTDILGFALILPWSRKRIGSVIVQYLITHLKTRFRSGHFFYRSSPPPDDIIDVEYEETPEPSPEPSQTPNDGDSHDQR